MNIWVNFSTLGIYQMCIYCWRARIIRIWSPETRFFNGPQECFYKNITYFFWNYVFYYKTNRNFNIIKLKCPSSINILVILHYDKKYFCLSWFNYSVFYCFHDCRTQLIIFATISINSIIFHTMYTLIFVLWRRLFINGFARDVGLFKDHGGSVCVDDQDERVCPADRSWAVAFWAVIRVISLRKRSLQGTLDVGFDELGPWPGRKCAGDLEEFRTTATSSTSRLL